MHDALFAWLVVQTVMTQLAWFLAALLLVSAVHKVRERQRTLEAIRALTGVSARDAGFLWAATAGVEAVAGALLLTPRFVLPGAGIATLLWCGYLFFLARSVRNGRSEVDCGCSFGPAHRPIGDFQLYRASLLSLLGTLVCLSAAVAPGQVPYETGWAVLATQAVAAVALLSLYAALDQVMSLQPLRPGFQA